MNRRIFSALLLLVCAAPAFADSGILYADGDTKEVQMAYPHLHVSGDFGGGTMTFYYRDSNGTWRAMADAAFTAATDVTLEFERIKVIKGTLSGSTSPALVWSID